MRAFYVKPIVLQIIQFVLFFPSFVDVMMIFYGVYRFRFFGQSSTGDCLHLCLGFFLSITAYLAITNGWDAATHFASWFGRKR